MAQNSLYPGFVKINYAVLARPHEMIIPVMPEETFNAGVEPRYYKRDGFTIEHGAAITAFMPLVQALYNTAGTDFITAEYWQYPDPDSDPQFIYVSLIGLQGNNAAAVVDYSQLVMSFRTAGGGIRKFYFMETTVAANTRQTYPFSNAAFTALSNYIISADSWLAARDNTFCIAPLRALGKTNDALRKKYATG